MQKGRARRDLKTYHLASMHRTCQLLFVALLMTVLVYQGRSTGQRLDKVKRLPGLDVCGKNRISLGSKVINGKPAELGAYPWMAALGYRSRSSDSIFWGCAGSLITNQYVVTAAHCILTQSSGYRIHVVRLGELDLNEDVDDGASPVDVLIESTVTHREYDNRKKLNDIALVKMERQIVFTDLIRPICLPPAEFYTKTFVGHRPIVAGWGRTVADHNETYVATTKDTRLLEADVMVQDLEECNRNITTKLKRVIINEKHVCAAGEDTDACKGDSGGPLMYYERLRTRTTGNMFLMGIVSYGYGCAVPGYPGVYTRVAHQMLWIIENMDI